MAELPTNILERNSAIRDDTSCKHTGQLLIDDGAITTILLNGYRIAEWNDVVTGGPTVRTKVRNNTKTKQQVYQQKQHKQSEEVKRGGKEQERE